MGFWPVAPYANYGEKKRKKKRGGGGKEQRKLL